MYRAVYKSQLLNLHKISELTGIPYTMLYARYKRGWRGDMLVSPVQRDRSFIILTHNGKTMSLKDWSKEIGIAYETLRKRHKAGKPVADILHPDTYPTPEDVVQDIEQHPTFTQTN